MARVDSAKVGARSGEGLDGLTVCFDLDGTLVDTAADLVRVTNAVIAMEGLSETDYEQARAVVSLGSRRLITDALDRAEHDVPHDRIDMLQKEFLRLYAEDIAQRSEPYPGVVETLTELKALGATLAVCTNKPGYLARPLLDALELSKFFVRTVGGDEAPKSKPDPRHVFMAAGHDRSDQIVMVGDSYPDTEAGRRAGVFTVLVTYGYSVDPLESLRADARTGDFRTLTPTLVDWYGRRRSADDVSKP